MNGLEIKDKIGIQSTLFMFIILCLKIIPIYYFKGRCIIYEIEKLEGEASANNRKAKLIFFYEWAMTLKWKVCLKCCIQECVVSSNCFLFSDQGTLTDTTKTVEGTVSIPNLSDENDPKDLDISFATTTSSPEADILKQLMRSQGTQLIRDQLAKYIKSLKEG